MAKSWTVRLWLQVLTPGVTKQAGPQQAMLVVAGSEALDQPVEARLGNGLHRMVGTVKYNPSAAFDVDPKQRTSRCLKQLCCGDSMEIIF
jgi:hypothetical protein